jgi:hypothetical protein
MTIGPEADFEFCRLRSMTVHPGLRQSIAEMESAVPMRYITALVGALLIFAGVFILTAILVAFLPPIFSATVTIGAFYTNNIIGVLLGSVAATASFRATLHRARANRTS